MARYGIFNSEEDRDAFVAERDRMLDAEAAALKGIGIKDRDDLASKYGALCHLYETGELPADDDPFLMTSPQAREFASKVIEVMNGGPAMA